MNVGLRLAELEAKGKIYRELNRLRWSRSPEQQ
jgi:hypothetical protein